MKQRKMMKTEGDTSWFTHDRFGMFIHWGTYALAARHEWVKRQERIPDDVYEKYFRHFDPDLYDPRIWARAAAKAGMKYFVITTKHHEGFCLWDSAQTDYKVTNTPYGKDVLTPMVDAYRNEGLRVGFYHSLLDWHHPQYPIDSCHPMAEHPDALKWNRKRDVRKYADYLYEQSRELLTQFGHIDVLWYDFSWDAKNQGPNKLGGKNKADWQSERLIKMIRELQPHVMLNDRLQIGGDMVTPEQWQPREWIQKDGLLAVWEACQTFSGSWGYHRDETTWKSTDQLVQMLINSVSRGGNLLMNVGPTGRGEFDERALSALDVYARWMRVHGRAIYGCTQSNFKEPQDCRYTQNGKRLYLHVYAWPFQHIVLEGLRGRIEYAQLLNDASEVKFFDPPNAETAGNMHGINDYAGRHNGTVLHLPIVKPNVTVPVVEIFLK